MGITATEIHKIVEDADDFGFEMRVGASMHAVAGLDVRHGGTYTDAVTEKPRQFDYRCSLAKGPTKLSLAVECKNIDPSYPVIICGTARREQEAFHDLILAGGIGSVGRRVTPVIGPYSKTLRTSGESGFYPKADFVGKSVLRLKPSNGRHPRPEPAPDSDVHERWAQALASGVGLVQMACNFRPTGKYRWSAILPIVVLNDGSLWKIEYDKAGAIVSPPSQVDECDFYVARQITVACSVQKDSHVFVFSHIHFLTLKGFISFLNRITSEKDACARLFPADLLR